MKTLFFHPGFLEKTERSAKQAAALPTVENRRGIQEISLEDAPPVLP